MNPPAKPKRLVYLVVLALMVLIPMALVAFKLLVLDYPMAELIPTPSYRVEMNLQVDGHGEDISIRTYLPKTDTRQSISEELNSSGALTLELESNAMNRVATWKADNVQGKQDIRYEFSAQARHIQYRIPDNLPIPQKYPDSLLPYLAA
jgi:hypothetical protein